MDKRKNNHVRKQLGIQRRFKFRVEEGIEPSMKRMMISAKKRTLRPAKEKMTTSVKKRTIITAKKMTTDAKKLNKPAKNKMIRVVRKSE